MASPTTRPGPQTTLNTPAGKPDLVGRVGQHQRAQRRNLRRFEHHGASGGKRRRDLRDNLMQRVVPRRDAADDADRILDDERIAELFFEAILADELGVEPDRGDREFDLHLRRKTDRRADFVRDRFGHLRHARLHRRGQLVEPIRALFGGGLPPRAVERRARGLDGAIDVLGVALRDAADGFFRRRRQHVDRSAVDGFCHAPS